MPVAIIELLAKVGLYFLSWFMQKSAKDDQSKRDYIAFLDIMNRKGLSSVQMRLTADGQIERVKELWKNETK